MQVGENIELTIVDITSEGDGLGRTESGAVVFVPGSAPGEEVRCVIADARKNHYKASLLEIVKPSPFRIKPECPFFDDCPGCSLQFLSYDGQCGVKLSRIKRIFEHTLGTSAVSPDFLPSPEQFGYRTHITVTCEKSGDDISIGYINPETRAVVDIPSCMLVPVWAESEYVRLRSILAKERENYPDHLRLRLFFDHENKHVYVVHTRGPMKRQRRFPRSVRTLTSSFLSPKTLTHEIDGIRFRLHPASFIQANHFITPALYGRTIEEINAGGNDVLLDLYSGNGYFTLAFADRVLEAVAVESDSRACDNLMKSAEELSKSTERRKKKRARKPSVTVAQDRAENVTGEIVEGFKPTIVVANPPRTGLHPKVLDALTGVDSISRIVMVSCDPYTCVRDARELIKTGFEIGNVTVVDCYPQTAHAELIMTLSR
ncbi:MAG TPA: class I SAM-dependent RNA methyltransferase [Firmicutes bacterium]|nr:class I SAM-dependent RNA methyltransferase [Bacillota bacterium]